MVKIMYVPMNKFRRPETSPAGAHMSGPRTKPRTKPDVTIRSGSAGMRGFIQLKHTHHICVDVVAGETSSDRSSRCGSVQKFISRQHCGPFVTATHNVDDAIETAKVATAAIIITVHLYRGFHVIGFS